MLQTEQKKVIRLTMKITVIIIILGTLPASLQDSGMLHFIPVKIVIILILWIHNFIYSITVSDEDVGDTVNVSLWLNKDNTGWQYYTFQTCTDCSSTLMQFNRSYYQTEIGNWSFKFNATDSFGNGYELFGGSHNVVKDNITISNYQGNNSNVNRSSGNVRIATMVYDSDSISNITNVSQETFYTYITNQSNNWILQNELINSTGKYYYYDFDPDCNYLASQQSWKTNVTGDDYYGDASSLIFTMNILGDLNNTIISPVNTNFTVGDLIVFRGRVIDDCDSNMTGLTLAKFNVTNGKVESYQANDENNSYYNYTWNSASKSAGFWNVTFYTGQNSYNPDFVDTQFYLSAIQELLSPGVVPVSGGWGKPNYTYSITVSDEDVGDTVNVSLWLNKDNTGWQYYTFQTCTDCSSTLMQFNRSYYQTEIGNWSFKFNATDSFGNGYELFGGSHNVVKDNITISNYQGNNSNVNRSNSQPGSSARIA